VCVCGDFIHCIPSYVFFSHQNILSLSYTLHSVYLLGHLKALHTLHLIPGQTCSTEHHYDIPENIQP